MKEGNLGFDTIKAMDSMLLETINWIYFNVKLKWIINICQTLSLFFYQIYSHFLPTYHSLLQTTIISRELN